MFKKFIEGCKRPIYANKGTWMLYGLVEFGLGAVAAFNFANIVHKNEVEKKTIDAFDAGRYCGNLETAMKCYEIERKEGSILKKKEEDKKDQKTDGA